MLRLRLFGIPFAVGVDFWIGSALLGANVAQGADATTNLLVWIACVFVSITVHELGHAFAARHYGVEPAIELHAFGGFTRMLGRGLTRPEGFWVTLAGPAAGFGLYLLTLAVRTWSGRSGWLMEAGDTSALVALKALLFLTRINLVWTLFNLLPILPLDGGRLLAALLGPNRASATQNVGVFFASSLAVLAVLYGQWWTALFLAYMAFLNFRATPYALPSGIGR